jgi:6-phosphogluconate dehydrogenase
MQIGFIGLGKMGGNMVLRLAVGSPDGKVKGTHTVVGYAHDLNPDLAGVKAIEIVASLDAMIEKLSPPRAVWVMVPAGKPTESVITDLAERLKPGDLIVDGGNSYYKDTLRRADALKQRQIAFVDVGTSGGIWGRQEGYCMMVGGDAADVQRAAADPRHACPARRLAAHGRPRLRHFVKMIHNGIEYGLMEATRRFSRSSVRSNFDVDLHKVAHVWNRGSVIRSWLLELAEQMLKDDPTLQTIQPYVEDSGEGRWTVQAAIDENVPRADHRRELCSRALNRATKENLLRAFRRRAQKTVRRARRAYEGRHDQDRARTSRAEGGLNRRFTRMNADLSYPRVSAFICG